MNKNNQSREMFYSMYYIKFLEDVLFILTDGLH